MICSVKNKLLFSTIIMLLISSLAHAQWSFELWHEGKIVLESGDTLKGLVKYDLQQNIVQYTMHDKKAEVFTARKVLFFEFFDGTIHKYRHFFALPFSSYGDYRTPIFFELLEQGKMTLLAREQLEYKNTNSPYYVGSYSRLVMSYRFFFLKDDGKIEEFKGSKNDLLDMMGNKADQVEKFMKANHLKFDDRFDLARIVAYYNSLSGT